jgi:hypothetical protein
LLWLFTLVAVRAAAPEFMTYQGFLVDGNGNALAPSTPANYPVIFRIFTAPTGGSRLWSEQQIVTVDKGNFSVILGEGTPVSGETPKPLLSSVMAGPNNADRYMSLSVTIGSTTSEMLPRLRLLPGPYAFSATSANQIVNPTGTPVLTYANSRVEVTGNLASSGVISGNGSGLTGLTAAQIPALSAASLTTGTLADARLTPNVALRAGGNAFTGNQTIAGNLAIAGTGIPLNFGASLGDKISLYGASGNHYGLGIQAGTLQIHTDSLDSRIAFGYGSSAAMTETMRITGGGNLGLGTTTPAEKLQISEFTTGASSYLSLRTGGGNLHRAGIKLRHFNDTHGFDIESDERGANNGLNILRYPGAAPSSAMFIDRFSGNLGVNTTTPAAKLHVNGTLAISGANTLELGAGVAGKEGSAGKIGYQAFTANALDIIGAGTTFANRKVKVWAAGGTEFAGSVGINTATPRVPLDVRGSVNFTLTATQADTSIDVLDAFGLNNGPSAVTKSFSILAENHVGAVGFVASSDRRIKTGITTSPKEKDLAAIQQLRVAEYRMTDTMSHGAARRKGFIAQEVEQIIPQAVSRSINFIPDIYVLATNASYTASTKTLALSLGKPHELRVGDRVRLQLDSDRRELTVAGVPSPYEFVVDGCEQSPQKVFVYGREVDDFRAVDYDQIFTASIGAIQALAAKVQALESENKRIAQLEKDAVETELKHKSAIRALHRDLDGLKQLVQQMAAARTTPQDGAAARKAEAAVSGTETVATR